jgi:pimeloyl-ACP methyl ester carboxylesterase
MNHAKLWTTLHLPKLIFPLLFAFCALSASSAQAGDLLHSCRVEGFAQQVQCGQLKRPLNSDDPAGKQIDLHFIVLPAQDKNKAPDPIFLLAGGPGQSAISVASWMQALFGKLQRRHDLVFVDQRGTGKSAPLSCPDSSDLNGIGQPDYEVQEILKCKTQLEKLPHGDLRWYTTSIAMKDLDAVRAALNYAQLDLIGISYGTRAALEYVRQFPSHVHRTILDGVVQPEAMLADDDLQKSLNQLFSDCAKDKRCQKAYPTLQQDWKKLLASMPQKTQLTHPRLGTTQSLTITRDDVLSWVTKVIYTPVNSAGLPNAILQANLGNFNPLLALSGAGGLPNPGAISFGMHFSVVCSEEYEGMLKEATPPIASNDFGDLHKQMYLKVCKNWPRSKVPQDFYTTPVSTTPILLLSGGIDPVTPPWHAAQVAKALGAKTRHIVLDNSGHGMLTQTCLSEVATNFINAKTEQEALNVDTSCVKQIPRPSVWIAPSATSTNEVQP